MFAPTETNIQIIIHLNKLWLGVPQYNQQRPPKLKTLHQT